jgi:hypothetical protein
MLWHRLVLLGRAIGAAILNPLDSPTTSFAVSLPQLSQATVVEAPITSFAVSLPQLSQATVVEAPTTSFSVRVTGP